ncbi:hypothetical protein A9Q76_00655 [Arcobacter sp. 31_11_sub10_T18]|nr:hypothetical protein A9Q76_00655 [Arcobacter sp. 31_11_sub10_T18]
MDYLSSEAILVGILIILLFINHNIGILIREIKSKASQPTSEQIQMILEQMKNTKWHVDEIRKFIKYGESKEESELKNDAQWLKTFEDNK